MQESSSVGPILKVLSGGSVSVLFKASNKGLAINPNPGIQILQKTAIPRSVPAVPCGGLLCNTVCCHFRRHASLGSGHIPGR